MAIICEDYNLLFIMSPRTACTAIGKVLCDRYGGQYLPKTDIVDKKRNIVVQQKHSTVNELIKYNLISEKELANLLKFTCVRNPFDSLVSLYIKKKTKYQPLLKDPNSWVNRLPNYAKDMEFCQNHSFNEWIVRKGLKGLIKRILLYKPSIFDEYTAKADILMRYEKLNEDFKTVLNQSGIEYDSQIPMINPTSEREHSDYRVYYSYLARKLVEITYYNDFKNYNYCF